MGEHGPQVRHRADYTQRLLGRFRREVLDRGRQAQAFPRLCDMVAIPRDLRAALLQDLVQRGYVQPEGGDLVSLTAAGLQAATAPSPPAAMTDNPTPRDGESLARLPGGRERG